MTVTDHLAARCAELRGAADVSSESGWVSLDGARCTDRGKEEQTKALGVDSRICGAGRG
jgi:hypothetical protein